jgi:UDPglucose 6-dehydrogenase
MKIGICGFGFVGNAINSFFVNANISTYIYDKYKNINTLEYLLETDLIFICLPTNINDDNHYDMTEINITMMILENLKYSGLVIIKSTVLPKYCSFINNLYPTLKIINNPEFLSSKTAVEDFANQKHIILGYTIQSKDYINILQNMYLELFPNATISITSAEESALTKLACNSFYATKIQFFTELYLLSNKLNLDYDNVRDLMLKNDWINPMHTKVPGNDGKISYGGACLPKDIRALSQFMNMCDVSNLVLDAVIKDNDLTRK